MEKIKLINDNKYILITNGVYETDNQIRFSILREENQIQDVIVDFDNPNNVSSISLLNEIDELIQSPYNGYSLMKSVKLETNVVIAKENIGTEDDPIYRDVFSDIYIIVLAKPDIEYRVEQNTAYIDYIAMEMGVEL